MDEMVVAAVLAGRFLLPLFIPKYPLPAILLCLVLDAADQTLLQMFTGFDLSGYQAYDKALDIYYLSIAMLATMRNWRNHPAVIIARFLFYYRLLGVVLFELTGSRIVLLLFPNTFEYFFIFYESIRSFWNPTRIHSKFFITSAAVIWLVIKLPQEYWLHVAKLDVTELIRTHILGSPGDVAYGEGMAQLVILAGSAIILFLAAKVLRRTVRPFEHELHLKADPVPGNSAAGWNRNSLIVHKWRMFDHNLVEKIFLVGFVSVAFAQMLPDMNFTTLQLFSGVAVFVLFNTFLRLQGADAKHFTESTGLAFVILALINISMASLVRQIVNRSFFALPDPLMLFFLLLLTLIVTLYDRFRPLYDIRFPGKKHGV